MICFDDSYSAWCGLSIEGLPSTEEGDKRLTMKNPKQTTKRGCVMKHIIIGIRGQIGTCVHTFLLNDVKRGVISGIDLGDRVVERDHLSECVKGDEFDMMHVCIPFSSAEGFHTDVSYYMKAYPSKHVIIYSTVLPGVTERLGENVVHSPVEGRHPKLYDGFKTFTRLVGGKDSKVVGAFYKRTGLSVETFEDAKVTELGKILSTTRYGINILFAAEQKALCDKFGLKFEEVILGYQRMYNEGYKKLNEDRFVQQMLTPPVGKIGGHCVVPNAKLLQQITDSEFVRMLAKFNGE